MFLCAGLHPLRHRPRHPHQAGQDQERVLPALLGAHLLENAKMWAGMALIPSLTDLILSCNADPYPNVDAHSGVLLTHYGMVEEDYYTARPRCRSPTRRRHHVHDNTASVPLRCSASVDRCPSVSPPSFRRRSSSESPVPSESSPPTSGTAPSASPSSAPSPSPPSGSSASSSPRRRARSSPTTKSSPPNSQCSLLSPFGSRVLLDEQPVQYVFSLSPVLLHQQRQKNPLCTTIFPNNILVHHPRLFVPCPQ